MLRKKEKQTLTRLFLLGVGAPIGLDRFYEGDVTGGFLAILGFLIALITWSVYWYGYSLLFPKLFVC